MLLDLVKCSLLLAVSSRFRIRVRFSVWLVSSYAHVFLLL